MHWRRQLVLGQLFGQQSRHMAQVLRGLGRAHLQLAGGRHIPAFVEVPGQPERAQPALPAQQPGLQPGQQAQGAVHQRRRVGHQRVELDFFLKMLGQHLPLVLVGHAAACAVQRVQQFRAKAPGHAVARQAQQIVPGAAADAFEHAQVRARRAQAVHGQVGDALPRPGAMPGLHAQACHCYQRSSTLRPLDMG